MSISDLLAVYIVRNFEHLFSQEDWNNSKMCSSKGIQLEETDLFRAPGLFGPWNADDDGNDDKDDGDDYDDDDDDRHRRSYTHAGGSNPPLHLVRFPKLGTPTQSC